MSMQDNAHVASYLLDINSVPRFVSKLRHSHIRPVYRDRLRVIGPMECQSQMKPVFRHNFTQEQGTKGPGVRGTYSCIMLSRSQHIERQRYRIGGSAHTAGLDHDRLPTSPSRE